MKITLDSIADAIGFRNWVFSQYSKFIRWGKIWEIGSGIGNMSEFLIKADYACLTEYDEVYRKKLAERFSGLPNVTVEHVDLTKLDIERYKAIAFDTIISTNVLEHVEDDLRAIKDITATMNDEAVLITLVPAHPALYGKVDKNIGHYRRYTKRALRKVLSQGGQEVISLKYFNRVSAMGWFVKYKILRSDSLNENDMSLVERLLPFLRMEKYLPMPFGLSLIAVSRKKL